MKKAFTLIELLIVIGVIAVLTVAFLPNALSAPAKARDSGRIKTVNDIVAAIETYRGAGRTLPTSLGNCFAATATSAGTPALPGIPALLASSFQGSVLPSDRTVISCAAGAVYVNPAAATFPFYYFVLPTGGYVVGAQMENVATGNYLLSATTPATGLTELHAYVNNGNRTVKNIVDIMEGWKTTPLAGAARSYYLSVST